MENGEAYAKAKMLTPFALADGLVSSEDLFYRRDAALTQSALADTQTFNPAHIFIMTLLGVSDPAISKSQCAIRNQ